MELKTNLIFFKGLPPCSNTIFSRKYIIEHFEKLYLLHILEQWEKNLTSAKWKKKFSKREKRGIKFKRKTKDQWFSTVIVSWNVIFFQTFILTFPNVRFSQSFGILFETIPAEFRKTQVGNPWTKQLKWTSTKLDFSHTHLIPYCCSVLYSVRSTVSFLCSYYFKNNFTKKSYQKLFN